MASAAASGAGATFGVLMVLGLVLILVCGGLVLLVGYNSSSRAEADANVLQQLARKFRSKPTARLQFDSLSVGDVGTFPHIDDQEVMHVKVTVLQVVDESNMLAKVATYKMYDKHASDEITVWLSGVSTAGIVDGESLHPDGGYGVIGTRQYTTVLGAGRTVYELRRLPR